MCQDLSKANKHLKKEVTLLRFKVTRLTNKMENNQKQWVETLQEIQQESHQDALEQDCGKCFDIGVCVWGGGRSYSGRLRSKEIPGRNYSKEVTLAFKNAKNKTSVAVLLFPC